VTDLPPAAFKPDARWIQVLLDDGDFHATFGIVVRDGWVIAAAPVARRAVLGRREDWAAAHFRRRGGRFRDVTTVDWE
jgi:hypothetical protein